MNKFINRQRELDNLGRCYDKPGASLAVLYGRRRLGKTALLRKFAQKKRHCYYMADRAAEPDLRHSLTIAMAEALGEPTLASAEYSSWYDLFATFDRIRNNKEKFILIFDEYQYLCQVQPAFSSFIQKWWDEHWKNSKLKLILCGSVTSMMYRETLSSLSTIIWQIRCKYSAPAGYI